MAVTRSEATSLVNKCTNHAMSIQKKISTIKMKLDEIQNRGKEIVNKIPDGIMVGEIISGSHNILIGNVGNIVSDCEGLISDYLKRLADDVNNYIEKIEVMYNQTLKEGETPLYFNRITLESSGSFVSEEHSQVDSITQGSGNNAQVDAGSNTDYSTTSSGSTSSEPEATKTEKSGATTSGNNPEVGNSASTNKDPLYENLNYILNVNSTSSIDSSKFNNWNLFIKEFLKRNNFEKYVTSIILKDKRVICRMTSGREYHFDNINSSVELINTIKGVI